jgi:AcrR family transcriptional regulator
VQRRSRNDYFEAGLALLAEGGAKAVTIDNLCARLGTTKGSFYHHFASGPAFMSALLAYWENEYSQHLAEAALAVDDPVERLELIGHVTVELNHEAESAIRALARTDPVAEEVQRRIDIDRARMLARTLREAGVDPAEARRLAHVALAVLIGLQQQTGPIDRAWVRDMVGELQRWLGSRIASLAP